MCLQKVFQSCTVPIAVYQQAVVRYKFFGFHNLKTSELQQIHLWLYSLQLFKPFVLNNFSSDAESESASIVSDCSSVVDAVTSFFGFSSPFCSCLPVENFSGINYGDVHFVSHNG